MSNVNRGKQFEQQICRAFEKVPDTSTTRLQDPQSKHLGIRNICDYIMYHFPLQYFVECKSCYGNSLPFSNITQNQWDGLLEKSRIPGVIAGYYIWFIDKELTVFISAPAMAYLKQNSGRKSVNADTFANSLPEELQTDWCVIPGTKKRILFEYDLTTFMEKMCHHAKMSMQGL